MRGRKLRAAIYDEYGPPSVVRIVEVPKPRPKPGELLIRVDASTLTAADWRMRRPSPFLARLYNGLLRPKRVRILGFELSGQVEDVGEGVSRFNAGDEVFAWTGFGMGGHAEYCCLPEASTKMTGAMVERKPAGMSHHEAAAVPVGGDTARGFLKKAKLQKGQSILIYGASGSVGTYAIQIARILGAQVTAVCSTSNLQLVSSLGAERVIDYTTEDVIAVAGRHDVVFDAVGKLPSSSARKMLRKGGRFVTVASFGSGDRAGLVQLREWIEGSGLRAVIDRRYPLEAIAQAHEYVEQGHKKGNVVITMY